MHIDQQILEKYFKGKCTADEQALVETYLAREDKAALDRYLMNTWEQVQAESETPATMVSPEPVKEKKVKNLLPRYWYRVAAAVAGLLGLFTWLWQSQQKNTPQVAMVKWDTLMNNSHKVQLYTMPDGSQVWLNAHSSLAYTYGYNKGNRDLWLQGEGYFVAAPNEELPFRVHTGALVTTVLGTEFNIATANRADGSIQVSLLKGKVSVSVDAAFSKVLLPGQMLEYKKGSTPAISTFRPLEILDWKTGQLIFEETPLEDVFARLESRWGYRIMLKDKSLSARKVTGRFKTDMPLEQILSTLEYVHSFTSKRVGDSSYLVVRRPGH